MHRKQKLGFGLGFGNTFSEMIVVPALSQSANARLKFEWQCGAGKTTLPEKYRPKDCRGASAPK